MTRPTLTPALSGLLGGWLPRQRWFPVKSAAFSFEPAGGLSLAGGPGGATGAAGLEVLLLAVSYPTPDGSRTDVVQVPLSIRRAPLAGAESALIGQISESGPAGSAGARRRRSARRPVGLRRRPRPGVHRGVAGTDAQRRHHAVRECYRPPR